MSEAGDSRSALAACLLHSLAEYGFLGIVAFAFGLTLLRVLAPDLPARIRLGLAPSVSLSVWVWGHVFGMRLGGSVRVLSNGMWILTAVVVLIGLFSGTGRLLRRRRVRRQALLLALLPPVLLAPAFVQGLDRFCVPRVGDLRTYVTMAHVAWTQPFRRIGDDDYPKTASLYGIRAGTVSMLGFLSRLHQPGEALMAVNLHVALALLALAGATLALARALRLKARYAAVLVLLTVSGRWTCHSYVLHHLDQLLGLGYLPACAAVLLGTRRAGARAAVLLGGMTGVAAMIYPEGFPFTSGALVTIAAGALWRHPRGRRFLRIAFLAASACVALEVLPLLEFQAAHVQNVRGQADNPSLNATFAGLGGQRWLAAWFGLGPERGESWPLVDGAGLALAFLFLLGLAALVRRRNHGLAAACLLLSAAASAFILGPGYLYAAYKVTSLAWPLTAAVLVVAIECLGRCRARAARRVGLAVAALLVGAAVGPWWRPFFPPMRGWDFPHPVDMSEFHLLRRDLDRLAPDAPVWIKVPGFAGDWLAVLLGRSRRPILTRDPNVERISLLAQVGRWRMPQPEPAQVLFVITSPAEHLDDRERFACRIRQGRYFTVWKLLRPLPAILDACRVPWPDHPWLGEGPDEGLHLEILSDSAWPAHLEIEVAPGPGRAELERALVVEQDGEPRWTGRTTGGRLRVPLQLPAGRSVIRLYCTDAATIRPLPNGDTRSLLLEILKGVVVPARDAPDHLRLELRFRD